VGDDPERVRENHRRLAARVGYDPARLHQTSQVHGAAVWCPAEGADPEASRTVEADALVTRSAGDAAAAQASWAEAAPFYEAALRRPQALGSLAERANVRYNYACCLAGGGKVDQAGALLQQLIAAGSVAAADALTDPDLAGVQGL
jgi:hypothetical protein